MKHLLLYSIALLINSVQVLVAQDTAYRKHYDDAWQNAQLPPNLPQLVAEAELLPATAAAVVLYEHTQWLLDTRADAVHTTGRTFVQCYRAVLVRQASGSAQCNTLTLPEPNDPAREYADVPLKQRSLICRPKYMGLQIAYVRAKLLRPNQAAQVLHPLDATQTERMLFNSTYRYAYSYRFDWGELLPNDILLLEYSYYLPYTTDWNRLFFHANLPKLRSNFTLQYPNTEYVVFAPHTPPTDSSSLRIRRHTYVQLQWQLERLAACMNETNARPYADLPHLFFYFHNKQFGTYHDAQIDQYLPYSWQYYTYDRLGFANNQRYQTQRLFSSKELSLNRFCRTYGTGNSPLYRLQHLHQRLCDRFGYQQLPDHFANTDARLATFTDDYTEQMLHEINHHQVYYGVFDRIDYRRMERQATFNPIDRQLLTNAHRGITNARLDRVADALRTETLYNINSYAIYDGFCKRLGCPYYQVLTTDQRIGSIQPAQCMPVLGEQRLLAIAPPQQPLTFVYPKNNKTGYALNRLPFYAQNAPAVLVSQMVTDAFVDTNLVFTTTPATTYQHNRRISVTQANMSLSTKSSAISRQTVATGNYQDILSAYYINDDIDSSIAATYYQHIGKLANSYQYQLNEQQQSDTLYRMGQSVVQSGHISALNDTCFSIDLSGWLTFQLAPIDEQRTLPYYPDFEQSDTHLITLHFDTAVRLLPNTNAALHSIGQMPDIGEYVWQITQPDPHTINISTGLAVRSSRISVPQLPYLLQLTKAVAAAQQLHLQVVRLTAP